MQIFFPKVCRYKNLYLFLQKIIKYANVIENNNHGLKEQELRTAVDTCIIYRENFIAEWHKRFE